MLGKLLGSKKSDSFYLKLEGEDAPEKPVVVAPVSEKKAKPELSKASASKETASASQGQEQQAKSTPIDTSYSEEPFWVKLMFKTSEEKATETASEKTFATDYLIEKPKSRRRPGGSIDKFKTMARQTKVRF